VLGTPGQLSHDEFERPAFVGRNDGWHGGTVTMGRQCKDYCQRPCRHGELPAFPS
jgi:hypothetical protein